jgi:ubiquinol-cytochrome c reductase cytochrome b subunit
MTWITGAVAFLASVGTAFTGYLTQTNFDSQWISTQAKDGLFSTTLADNADALVWGLMMLLTLILVLVPVIPGVRSIPKLVPIHRLVWRDWNRRH